MVTELRPIQGTTSGTTTVNNSTTFVDVSGLAFSAAANATYDWDLVVYYTSGTTPDIKFQFVLPTSASLTGYWTGAVGAVESFYILTTASITIFDGSGIPQTTWAKGRIITASTAGTCKVQMAQNTANVSNTTVNVGSFFTARLAL
jgi:hypothetical protein